MNVSSYYIANTVNLSYDLAKAKMPQIGQRYFILKYHKKNYGRYIVFHFIIDFRRQKTSCMPNLMLIIENEALRQHLVCTWIFCTLIFCSLIFGTLILCNLIFCTIIFCIIIFSSYGSNEQDKNIIANTILMNNEWIVIVHLKK